MQRPPAQLPPQNLPKKPIGPVPQTETTIAFASDRSGNFDIYTMNVAGGKPTRLTFDPKPERDPSWSPDGKQIAFTRKEGLSDFTGDIYVMNADGSDQRLLVHGGGAPKFSPDGTKIAYHALVGSPTNPVPLGLWLINVDGTGKKLITDKGSDPTWTPDGLSLVYGGITGPLVNVWKIDIAAGSKREKLFNDPLFACMPDVSPDGLSVAYATAMVSDVDPSQLATKLVVERIGNKDGPRNRLSTSPHWEFAPSWSPDGSLIAFERDVDLDPHYATYAGGVVPGPISDAPSWLVIARADGSAEVELPHGMYSDADPAFAPATS